MHAIPNTSEASYDELVLMQSRRSVGIQTDSTTYHETKYISRIVDSNDKLSRTHHTVDRDNDEFCSEDDMVIGGDDFKVMKEVELMQYEDGFVRSGIKSGKKVNL